MESAKSAASRRLLQLSRTVAPQLAPASCASIEEMEGAAVGRFLRAKVVIWEAGQRGVRLSQRKIQEMFAARGLDAVFVQAHSGLPADATVLVTTGSPVGVELLAAMPSLQLVAAAFTGVDHIDLQACRSRNVVVVNVPNYSTDATAELAVGLILAQLRQLGQCQQGIVEGQWDCPPQDDLCTKTVGIVGVGKIGHRLAELLTAFRVKGLKGYDVAWNQLEPQPATAGLPGWSPRRQTVDARRHVSRFVQMGGTYVDTLAGLFLDSDIVCICLPLTQATQGLISEKLLGLLRPNGLLVNISRGGVIDETALATLLQAGRFRAAVDVFSTEPLQADSPLRAVPRERLLMTPHIGYQSPLSLENMLHVTLKNILAFLAGQATNVIA